MKKLVLTTCLCLFTLLAKAQDASVEKSIYGVQFGVLGVWVHNESRLTNSIALRGELGLDTGLYGSSESTNFLLGVAISLEPKWYYNLQKREDKSKRIDGNSGNFISLKMKYHPDILIASSEENITVLSDFSIVPTWGIRRNIGKHFNYEAGFGIGYIHFFRKKNVYLNNEPDVAVNLHARIGYKF